MLLQGLWWLPSIADADRLQPLKGGLAMAAAAAGEGGPGGAELLKLAAAQRMSTDSRRAAFCIIMGSEDYVDASDRLLRLPLKVCCDDRTLDGSCNSHLQLRCMATSRLYVQLLTACLHIHSRCIIITVSLMGGVIAICKQVSLMGAFEEYMLVPLTGCCAFHWK